MAGIKAKILRPKTLSRQAMDAKIKAGAEKAAEDMAKDMTKITRGWSDGGLEFVGKVRGSRREKWEIEVVPKNANSKRADIWGFLDKGTKGPYPIRPKKPGGKLRFASGYKAGSKPNRVTTTQSASFGDTVYANQVMHPGIKARNWTKLRIKKWQKKLPKYLEDAILEGIESI
jgi:hypothetical protein